MLYIIGMIGGMVEQIGMAMNNTALVNIGIMSSLVMPTDAMYRKAVYGVLTGPENPISTFSFNPFSTGNPPSNFMVIYTGLYIAVFVIAVVRIFSRRDI